MLSVSQELRVDITLQPGEQSQTVTVTGEPPQVNTANAVLGGTLGPGTIQDLPLNGRNFMNLLSLRPGVTIYPGGGAWTQTTNGLRPEHNVYLLDGITAIEPLGGQSTINSVSLAGDSATLLPLDTIQEFSTQQNPKAEFGWKPGSITSIALKSGHQRVSRHRQCLRPHRRSGREKRVPQRRSTHRQRAEAGNPTREFWRHFRRADQERQAVLLRRI